MCKISKDFQIGDKILILRPFYVTGKVGVICDVEYSQQKRWIIKIDTHENIVVSLLLEEFQTLN